MTFAGGGKTPSLCSSVATRLRRLTLAVSRRDAEIAVPGPGDRMSVKSQVHLLRGEIVSIGSHVDWIIWHLSETFTPGCTTKDRTARRWAGLKRHLKVESLADHVQPQIDAVDAYFDARNVAAHSVVLVTSVSTSLQLFRIDLANGDEQLTLISLDDLLAERDRARSGHEALQQIAQVLDSNDSGALRGISWTKRAILLGRG